ncbi:hypothetical protein Calag_0270 [Caldisphaera lagunensis DSM 15908]|uniref:Uncharacterized protein n=1 Tax=Caldisphaera lagunensis (strain DSM 15908 / JCM 11604 / ANMR 0165 / IC-154) TaxID=1056495 RepID=L0AAI1_CALLD|nr:hypothetical protein Calag_0270 [Caldisphaera lagunensis DSM 15908]
MIKLKEPPKIKILEAAGAIADGRVHITKADNEYILAKVISSEKDKEYKIVIKKTEESFVVYSNDNGTKLRGYVGYPIISVMMLLGILSRDQNIEEALKGIDWRKLNETYKKYNIVEEIVLKKSENKVPRSYILEFRKNVMKELENMNIYYDENLSNE